MSYKYKMRKCKNDKSVSISVICMVFLLSITHVFSQGEANIWYFGNNAGLDFNAGAPVALTNGALNTQEGVASICDTGGNLLFYTDGTRVWNNTHAIMTNGFGLLGDNSTSQSSIIVQKPNSNNLYYIFTLDNEGWADGLRYSEVDMNLSAGNGAVTANKNIGMISPTVEKITAIRHRNKVDIWILVHGLGNGWAAYLVTSAGIDPPVFSSAGLAHGGGGATLGCLKVSPDETKIAVAIHTVGKGELLDFDNCTGTVSNSLEMDIEANGYLSRGIYGVEFSPDNQILYFSSEGSTGSVYQFDISSGVQATVQASRLVLFSSSSWSSKGSLQLGPDGKIYIANVARTNLDVINNPNVVGLGCNYVITAINLAGRTSRLGLPNLYNRYLINDTLYIQSDTLLCGLANFSIQGTTVNSISSVLWDFGDGNSSTVQNTTNTYGGAGPFSVSVIINMDCFIDTLHDIVLPISCSPLPVELSSFTGYINKNGTHILNWVTVSEINNDYFSVQKSTDAINFQEFTQVQGAGTTQQESFYSAREEDPFLGVTYYRLKQFDFNGQYEYSQIIALDRREKEDVTIFPNPAKDLIVISLLKEPKKAVHGSIINSLGQEVYFIELTEKTNTIDVSRFSAGIYFVSLQLNDEVIIEKLVIQ